MLPLPLIRKHRTAPASGLRTWLTRVDEHTLWAFNAQPPLNRRRNDSAAR